MGRKLDIGLIKESVEELEKLLKKEKDVRVHRRIRVIYLIKTMENPKLQEIAEKVGIVKKTAFEYWDWYKKGGIENLKIKYKGRIPRLNKEELEKFKEKAKEGFDSLKSMQEWIKEEFNKELSIKTISYWCKKLGIKKKGQTFQYKER
jgi:transposase